VTGSWICYRDDAGKYHASPTANWKAEDVVAHGMSRDFARDLAARLNRHPSSSSAPAREEAAAGSPPIPEPAAYPLKGAA
jgi:hypothetical protein